MRQTRGRITTDGVTLDGCALHHGAVLPLLTSISVLLALSTFFLGHWYAFSYIVKAVTRSIYCYFGI